MNLFLRGIVPRAGRIHAIPDAIAAHHRVDATPTRRRAAMRIRAC
jgi:hypothetical protein